MVPALALTPLDFFSKIGFHPVPLVVIVALAGWYRRAVGVLSARGRVWPPLRSASWALALLLMATATLSGLDAYTATSFSVHAVEQLGLFMLAPVFLALSAPVTLALEWVRPERARRIRHAIEHGVGTIVLNPALTWAAFAAALFVLYFSGQYRLMLHHAWVLQLTNLELLAVGYLFVWPVIGVDPRPRQLAIGWRMLYVLVCTVYYSVLGLAMESQRTPIAPGLSVSDLHTGGGVLWSTGELLTIAMSVGILLQWLAADEGHALRSDRFNAEEDARQLAIWRADRRAAGLADVRARDSVIVRSRPSGLDDSDASAAAAQLARARPEWEHGTDAWEQGRGTWEPDGAPTDEGP